MDIEFQYDPKRREVRIVSEFFDNIREHFSVKNKSAAFNLLNPYLPKRLYSITPLGYCGLGLVGEIIKYITETRIPFKITFDEQFHNLIKSISGTKKELRALPAGPPLRSYQSAAVLQALNTGHGILVVATGGGKTLIMASLLNNIETMLGKVLIIVPDLGLVSQTYEAFIEYGIPEHILTVWTGKNDPDLTKNVIISNMGILQSKCSNIKWFNQISILFVDECHKIRRGNKLNKLLDKIHTHRRFGFTGTLSDEKEDVWNIMNQIGPVIYEKSTTELRELGGGEFISGAQVVAVHIEYDRIPDYTSVSVLEQYRLEMDFIINHPFRNKAIKGIVDKLDNNILVLVDRIEHGELLFESLKTLENKKVFFIQGSVEVEDRKKVQQLMELEDNVVCVAISKIFSTGISIKNIHYILFAAGGKSKIKTLQSIGRGLRVHENKECLIIIDIVDGLIYGDKHYEQRKNFYAIERLSTTTKNIYEIERSG